MPPLKLAIIGGGPSAFYVTSRLLHLLPTAEFRVHIYDRLWAPHGLVRYGVAPDHPEVKNCTHKFDTAASDPRIRFFGNVNVSMQPTPYPPLPPSYARTGLLEESVAGSSAQTGSSAHTEIAEHSTPHALPLSLHALFPYYTHLVFATGAPHPRLHPLLPTSPICIPALDIVHWYTMHPGSAYSQSASPIPLGARHITIIGHGNVSLDIARLLLTPPTHLTPLDIPAPVMRSLHETWNTLQHVSIVGRRGPREVRFTAKEVREMMSLQEARMRPIPRDVMRAAENGEVNRQQGRVMKLLKEGSKGKEGAAWTGKTFSVDFWRSPTGYTVLPESEHGARAVLNLEETRLDSVTGRAVGTGKHESLRTDLIVTSLGYEGDAALFGGGGVINAESGSVPPPTEGSVLTQSQLTPHSQSASPTPSSLPWYDPSAGHIRTHAGGRVLTPQGRAVRNVYAAGWAGRGARGVLAGTLLDAGDVAGAIVQDWNEGGGEGERGTQEHESEMDPLAQGTAGDVAGGLDGIPPVVEVGLREGSVIEYPAWRMVDEEEKRRGRGEKEREKMAWGDVVKLLKGTGENAV